MELFPKQLKTATRLYRKGGGVIWWRVGTGKTRVAYAWFAMIAKPCEILPRFIVVCRREAFADWTNELKKMDLPWRTWVVDKESDIYDVRTTKPLVYLVSHGMLAKLMEYFVGYSAMVRGVAFDEGFLYKNPQTKHCKAANRLSDAIGKAIVLSGSVMTARDLTDIYGQLYCINRHQSIARTLTEFRSRFLYRFQINPNASSQAVAWRAAKGAGERITRLIKPLSSFYFPTNDQRKVVTDIRTITPTTDQLRAFRELKEFYELSLQGRRIELKNAPSVIIKCQQISDGFVNLDGEHISFTSSKMDWLVSKVMELLAYGERVVIWTAFRYTVQMILQRLQKLKVKAYGMTGGNHFDIQGWVRDGQCAVATVSSGSSVNHFKDVAYAIYYSHSFRWLDMQQSRGRTNRTGSAHQTCFYYHLHTQGSLDTFVYQTVMGSQRAETEIIQQAVNSWLQTTSIDIL